MGKVKFNSKKQKIIFDEFRKNNFLRTTFYLTGGTALAVFYLHHRESEDLDFFTPKPYDKLAVFNAVTLLGKKRKCRVNDRSNLMVQIFLLEFPGGETVKIDFNHYPHNRVEKGIIYQSAEIDSLLDIAINKLITISQRTEVKDFVDLYFLLRTFTLWDLIDGVKIKFGVKMEPYIIAADFMKALSFENLPNMLVSLTLKQLQDFYRERAKKIGMSVVEK